MIRRLYVVLGSSVTLIALALGLFIAGQSQAATGPTQPIRFQTHALVGETTEQITQYALDYTHGSYLVTDTPTVRLSKPVSIADVNAMGFNMPTSASGIQHPLHIVILQGTFDLAHGAAPVQGAHMLTKGNSTFHYLALVFDVQLGYPVRVAASPDGRGFKQALNDPSLPDLPVHPLPSGGARSPIPSPHP